jgi:hypothetical protein
MPDNAVSLKLPAVRGQVLGSRELDPELSRFTGKELRRIEYVLTVRGDDAREQIETVIGAASNGEPLIPDADGGQWAVTGHKVSYSVTQSEPVYTYAIELTEHEVLSLGRVEFEGLALAPDPSRWSLNSDDDHFWVCFLVDLGPDEHQRFEAALEGRRGDYFPAQLVGITDGSIQMRFGRCLWERLDDGVVRHRIVLVGAGGDDEAAGVFSGLNQPELARTVEQAVIMKAQMNALIEELQQAGALGAEAASRIRRLGTIENVSFADQREQDRAVNIDSFMD